MLFVADEIPQELKTIIEFLNVQMNKSEVLGVEIKQYQAEDEKIRTLVSRIIGQTVEAQIKKGKNVQIIYSLKKSSLKTLINMERTFSVNYLNLKTTMN